MQVVGRFALRFAVSTVDGWFAPPAALTVDGFGRWTTKPVNTNLYKVEAAWQLLAPDATTVALSETAAVLGAFRIDRLSFPTLVRTVELCRTTPRQGWYLAERPAYGTCLNTLTHCHTQ